MVRKPINWAQTAAMLSRNRAVFQFMLCGAQRFYVAQCLRHSWKTVQNLPDYSSPHVSPVMLNTRLSNDLQLDLYRDLHL